MSDEMPAHSHDGETPAFVAYILADDLDVVAEMRKDADWYADVHETKAAAKVNGWADHVERLEAQEVEANTLIEDIGDELRRASDDDAQAYVRCGVYLSGVTFERLTVAIKKYLNPQTGDTL